MKFLIGLFLALVSFLAVSNAEKPAECFLPDSVNGNGIISCDGLFPSYTYKLTENICEEFIYGGCGGNDNRFFNLEECETRCVSE
ncbi:male accessory gland serine protease inhibitor-like [Episyrphus balteatus]|uniref:male accessory gland serine protease inhibitor-like n=1 Tax=Episyrphus balteatus TaxID=286459 RepID=UPI0024852166|nr:male accessory gland serine protease inhibitor-like [Episyrphus balteatus]